MAKLSIEVDRFHTQFLIDGKPVANLRQVDFSSNRQDPLPKMKVVLEESEQNAALLAELHKLPYLVVETAKSTDQPPIRYVTPPVAPLAQLRSSDVPRGLDPDDLATDLEQAHG